MDAHSFSDPIPVPDAEIPTWAVEVIRLKGDVIVGQLIVNRETLPPRCKGSSGTKKHIVLWKLPEDSSQIPRFGEHEKKRLWELFKEQKKLRRRRPSKPQPSPPPLTVPPPESEPLSAGTPSREEEPPIHPGPAKATIAISEEDFDLEIIMEHNGPSPSPPQHSYYNRRNDAVVSVPHAPSFDRGKANGRNRTNKGSPSSCTEIPPSREAVSLPTSQQHPDPDQNAAAHLLPPPPGFFAPVQDDSATATVLNHSSTPVLPDLSLPPPDDTTVSPSISSLRYFAPSLETTTTTTLSSTLSSSSSSSLLGRTVVQTFMETIGHGSVGVWLAYYHPHAVKSLLMGTAQVTVSTPLERQEQWETMVHHGGSWTVTGWTSHEPTPDHGIPSNHSSSSSSNDGKRLGVVGVVVIIGTTRQATGTLFSFCLSLVLATTTAPDEAILLPGGNNTRTRLSPPPLQQPGRCYNITNDVLTLFQIGVA